MQTDKMILLNCDVVNENVIQMSSPRFWPHFLDSKHSKALSQLSWAFCVEPPTLQVKRTSHPLFSHCYIVATGHFINNRLILKNPPQQTNLSQRIQLSLFTQGYRLHTELILLFAQFRSYSIMFFSELHINYKECSTI